MLILGVESSCDDTGVGIVADGTEVRANVLASQHAKHERYGGIVPSLAARQHSRAINVLLEQALEEAAVGFEQIDAVAVASDQGLAPSLAVGVAAAKTLALALDVPLLGVHHVEGHIYSNVMAHPGELDFPFVCLTVAGGHTMLLHARALGTYELLGGTRDDSAGEAYDKLARRLGLGYPGGPVIDRLAREGDPTAFRFPRPMLDDDTLDFSFSGLKSAVTRQIEELERDGRADALLPVEDLAASLQAAVVDVLVAKTLTAVERTGVRTVSVAGGVAANSLLRARLEALAEQGEIRAFFPPLDLCVDNGAMIAGVAYHLLAEGRRSTLALDYRANAPLGALGVRYRHASKYEA
jgi:N6-L-threonylcarbamoyladenine synthase